jgi:hypothetical protein
MTDKTPNIPSLKPQRTRYAKLDSSGVKRILIACSMYPSSLVSASILVRGALHSSLLFHVRFFEPLIQAETLVAYLGKDPSTLLFVIGLEVVGGDIENKDRVVLMESHTHSDVMSIRETRTGFPMAADAYTFSKEKFTVSFQDFVLAATGALLEDPPHDMTPDIIALGGKQTALELSKGFKIPGYNFLPLDEVFTYNIHPFLKSLSGYPDTCQSLLKEAEIPLDKWNRPLRELTKAEARRLTASLIPLLSASSIPSVLGSDYEVLSEKPTSPLRHISGIASLSQMAWSRRQPGLLLGVFVGDRARQLNNLVESYHQHARETIAGIAELNTVFSEPDSGVIDTEQYISVSMHDTPESVFPEIGRIALESDLAQDKEFLIISSEESITVIWTRRISLNRVLPVLVEKDIPFLTTSVQSLRIPSKSEEVYKRTIEAMKHALSEGKKIDGKHRD